MKILGTLHVWSQVSASSLSSRWHSTQALVAKQEGKQKVRFSFGATQYLPGSWGLMSLQSLTQWVQEKHSVGHLSQFSQGFAHSLSPALPYNSGIEWHWPWQLLYNVERKSLGAVLAISCLLMSHGRCRHMWTRGSEPDRPVLKGTDGSCGVRRQHLISFR